MDEIYVTYVDDEHVDNHDYDDTTDDDHDNNNGLAWSEPVRPGSGPSPARSGLGPARSGPVQKGRPPIPKKLCFTSSLFELQMWPDGSTYEDLFHALCPESHGGP